MYSTLLRNVLVIDPQSGFHRSRVDILIDQGHISRIDSAFAIGMDGVETLIEGDNLHVSPGWVDLYVQSGEPGHEWKEDLASLAKAAVQGGFTTLMTYPHTYPVLDSYPVIQALLVNARNLPVHLWVAGALTQGTEGKALTEMYNMHQVGADAFTDGVFAAPSSGTLLRGLQYLSTFQGKMIVYPLDQSLVQGGLMNEGATASLLGLRGMPDVSEAVAIAKIIELLHYYPAAIHFQPLTSARAIRLISEHRSSLHDSDPKPTIGVAIQHLVFPDTMLREFDTNYKVFPPLRSYEQVGRLREALQKGEIQVLCTGHQAQSIEEKKNSFTLAEYGMLGLQTAFSLANKYLIQENLIDLSGWVELISINPRQIMGKPQIKIEIGHTAELTLFNPAESWRFEREMLPSRAGNSPLLGETLFGKVKGIFNKSAFFQADNSDT